MKLTSILAPKYILLVFIYFKKKIVKKCLFSIRKDILASIQNSCTTKATMYSGDVK